MTKQLDSEMLACDENGHEDRFSSSNRRAKDTDRHVGARLRERRIMLGLTQPQLAELIGVTYQQAHKYEKGINRVAAGRLYNIARVLGVDLNYFFEGLQRGEELRATPQQRMFLELAKNFMTLTREHQQVICSLARALSESNPVSLVTAAQR
jgi:transcriptional regulator with XRE-family HTH domain